MIGRKQLPEDYRKWNERWGAPFGHAAGRRLAAGGHPTQDVRAAQHNPSGPDFGPFAFQPASHTRIYEYPWAYLTAELDSPKRLLDIGGGASGFQFVAGMEGHDVVNVDPTARSDYNDWSDPGYILLTPNRHQVLNNTFGTSVKLVAERIQDADLGVESFDRIFCLSVLEHLDAAETLEIIDHCVKLLRPGGMLLLTVDLFLDLKPFGVMTRNVWGINQDVHALVERSGLDLVAGDPRELLGFPEFDFERVVDLLPELLISKVYPVMTQTAALRKPVG
ncbi:MULTISPECIES: class I SAM-dependent methyltransferase [unclassified Nonomuraea]|uniref:class I SAM-dependent methyltransferase n=1 Tax=unclassified Nonomuraea TaxID=2593643 RepID=UPI0033DC76B1